MGVGAGGEGDGPVVVGGEGVAEAGEVAGAKEVGLEPVEVDAAGVGAEAEGGEADGAGGRQEAGEAGVVGRVGGGRVADGVGEAEPVDDAADRAPVEVLGQGRARRADRVQGGDDRLVRPLVQGADEAVDGAVLRDEAGEAALLDVAEAGPRACRRVGGQGGDGARVAAAERGPDPVQPRDPALGEVDPGPVGLRQGGVVVEQVGIVGGEDRGVVVAGQRVPEVWPGGRPVDRAVDPGRQAAEVVEAAGEPDEAGREHTIREAADVIYHLMVLLALRGVKLEEVERELARRFGMSGLEEKASRGQ